MFLSIGIIAGLITMVCWGIADFLQAVIIKKIGSIKTMFFANVLGLVATIVLLFIYYTLGGLVYIDIQNFSLLFLAGIIDLIAVYYFLKSFELGEVSVVTPISATYSLITVILAYLFLGEVISWIKWVSIFIIIFGIVLTSTDIKKLKNIYTAKGVKESLITLVLWGIYFFIIGRVSKNLSSIPGMAKIVVAANIFIFTSVINGFLMAGFAAYKHGVTSINDLKTRYVLPLFLVNLFLYTFAWLVINYGLTQDLVSLVAPVSSLYPAITVLLAGFFLKEKLVLNQKIGILTILGGIFLISI